MACWICGAEVATRFLDGRPIDAISETDLRITDQRYGRCGPLVQCTECGFVYADPLPTDELVSLYESLSDPEYVEGRAYRLQQMEHLLARLLELTPDARSLLDVGAASGLMVEAARARGLEAVGVEPSHALVEEARERGIPVLQGVHPHPELEGRRFDLVTAIDVIEHVSDPVGLLRTMRDSVAPGGQVVVTTPDIDSVARRLLGPRWWHFRVAHVCFFPTSAMERATAEAGLSIVSRERQRWWFSADYLASRVGSLVGSERLSRLLDRVARRARLDRVQVPLDLRDSWVYRLQVRPS